MAEPRRVLVLVKYVPDAAGERSFADADSTTVRTTEGLLSELDEYAVEEALSLAESGGWEVTVATMGPEQAGAAIRKALQMGADAGIHISDEALHGTDALGTSAVLAAAVRKFSDEGGCDLLLCGMASTDAGMSVIPAMLAERLGLPQVSFASQLSVEGDTVRIRRDSETATETIESRLPAVVSVTDQINEPRYPSFKGIMAAKKKPVTTWSLADLGIEPAEVGLAASWSPVTEVSKRPPRGQGTIITDDGEGGVALAEFLAAEKFI